MKRARILLATAFAMGSMFVTAPPAGASCETNPDVGDFCKAIDVVERAVCNTKPGQYLPECN
ncbi:MAG: hypothetical protein ACLGHL_07570 [Actinomycetota bacterium]